jgi:hypothetical protein
MAILYYSSSSSRGSSSRHHKKGGDGGHHSNKYNKEDQMNIGIHHQQLETSLDLVPNKDSSLHGSLQNNNANESSATTILSSSSLSSSSQLLKNVRGSCNAKSSSRRRLVLLLLGNVTLLLFLNLYYESWAPVTTFTCAFMEHLAARRQISGGKTTKNNPQQPQLQQATALSTVPSSSSSSRPPNVILIVHESLGGAALESTKGKEATPFYQSLQQRDNHNHNEDMYFFRHPRTVAGITQIATPAILTGLLAYDKEGVKIMTDSTIATEFKSRGYDTASFVSYGTDFYGSRYEILSDLLRPDFDHLFGVSCYPL